MSLDGLIATFSVVGRVNTDVFLFYVREILIPQLWVGTIVMAEEVTLLERSLLCSSWATPNAQWGHFRKSSGLE